MENKSCNLCSSCDLSCIVKHDVNGIISQKDHCAIEDALKKPQDRKAIYYIKHTDYVVTRDATYRLKDSGSYKWKYGKVFDDITKMPEYGEFVKEAIKVRCRDDFEDTWNNSYSYSGVSASSSFPRLKKFLVCNFIGVHEHFKDTPNFTVKHGTMTVFRDNFVKIYSEFSVEEVPEELLRAHSISKLSDKMSAADFLEYCADYQKNYLLGVL